MLEFLCGVALGLYVGTYYDCRATLERALGALELPPARRRASTWLF